MCRSQRDAGWALICSGVVVILQFALFLLLGVALACYYTHVQPGVSFDSSDRVLSTFIVDELPAGLGSGGSDSGGHLLRRHVDAFQLAQFFGLGRRQRLLSSQLEDRTVRPPLAVGQPRVHRAVRAHPDWRLALAAQFLADAVINHVLAIAGFTAGVLLGVFALGVLTRRVGQRAALVGLIAGVVVLTYVKFGTSVAYTWYALIGSLVTFVVGVLVSLVWPRVDRGT